MAQAPLPSTAATPLWGGLERRWAAPPMRWTALLLLTLVAYAPVARCGFIWDDDAYVTKNELVQAPGDLGRIWFDRFSTPQYYPLVFTSFWLEHRLWGLEPLGYHLTNVALHALNACLVYALLSRWHRGAAWWAALLMALHPLHVESVAWITERKNVLSGAFYLGAFLAYWEWRDDRTLPDRRGSFLYWLALFLFAMALLSKSITATLPAAVLVAVWWKEGRVRWSDAAPLLPFFALGITAGLHTAWLERNHVFAQSPDLEWSLAKRIATAGAVPWFYLQKIVCPWPLSFFYPRWSLDGTHPADWIPLAASGALIGGLLWKVPVWGRWPLASALYFGGTLFPVLGLLPVYPMRFSVAADHFAYLASLGPLLVLGLGIAAATERWPRTTLPIGATVVGVLMALVWFQLRDYKGLTTLWQRTLAKNPDCYVCHNELGLAETSLPKREAALRESLRLAPLFEVAWTNLGECLEEQGKTAEALAAYQQALEVEPRYMQVHVKLSHLYEDRGDLANAMDHARRSIRFHPEGTAYANLGRLLVATGEIEEGRKALDRALERSPRLVEALMNRAVLAVQDGKPAEAERLFRRAAAEDPGDVRVQSALGRICWEQGKLREGAEWFARLLERQPGDPYAAGRLALYLAAAANDRVRNPAQGLAVVDRAIGMAGPVPDLVLARIVALMAAGQTDEARALYDSRLRGRISPQIPLPVPLSDVERMLETGRPYRFPPGA